MKKLFLIFILLFYCNAAFSQNKYTFSGFVSDESNGEKLIGATLYIPETQKGISTNAYGFFSLSLPKDSLKLIISYIGYASQELNLYLDKNIRLQIELSPEANILREIEIKADREEDKLKKTQMSEFILPLEVLQTAPVLGGERDILKTLQLLPGVKSGNEGSAGLYIRGGSPDQNLVLLDGVPVYNVFHLFGFLSVFNADAINNVALLKGGIPARYGGRLSSVLDISMKEGNNKEFEGNFSISPVAASLTLQSPIKKDKSAFIISARRTWLDAIYSAIQPPDYKFGYNLYDLNIKYNSILNKNNRIYLSFYSGRDNSFGRYKIDEANKSKFGIKWGNTTSVLRWNKVFSSKLFGNTAISYSNYGFKQESRTNEDESEFVFSVKTAIRDLALQTDFDYQPAIAHSIKFGSRFSYLSFSPEVLQIKDAESDTTFNSENRLEAFQAELYAEDEFSISARFKMNYGLRFSLFQVQKQAYLNLQPRLALAYILKENISLKASLTQMVQYIHLLTNSSVGLPTDLWVASTARVKPQQSTQIAFGVYQQFSKKYFFSAEAYYKWMNQVIEYKEGTSYLFDIGTNWEDKVAVGKGDSYGIEFFLDKRKGKLSGWLGYTLAWTTRQFEEINEGRKYPFKFDRRHDISLLLNLKLKKQNSLSLTFVYATGNAITLPEAKYQGISPPFWYDPIGISDISFRNYISERNAYRMPAYHRMDIAYHTLKERKKAKHSWTFSIYNLYNRLNPYFLYIDNREGKYKQVSLFPIIPSIGYRLEF